MFAAKNLIFGTLQGFCEILKFVQYGNVETNGVARAPLHGPACDTCKRANAKSGGAPVQS